MSTVQSDNLPALRPTCPSSGKHGFMTYRPGKTPEQIWCGIWYDCSECRSSVLYHSPELLAFLDEQRTFAAEHPAQVKTTTRRKRSAASRLVTESEDGTIAALFEPLT